MLGNKKFKSVVIHTAYEGVQRDYIYELLEPTTFRSMHTMLEETTNNRDKYYISFETTEGVSIFRVYAVTGFDLGDPQ